MIKKYIVLFIFIFTSLVVAQSNLKLPDIIVFNPDSSKIKNIQILSLERSILGVTYFPFFKLSREIFLPPKKKFIVNPIYNYKVYKSVNSYFDISSGNENFLDINIKNLVNYKFLINNFSLSYNCFDNFYVNKLDKSFSVVNGLQFFHKNREFGFDFQYSSNKNIISNHIDERGQYSLSDNYYIDYSFFTTDLKYNYKAYSANVGYEYSKHNILDDEFYKSNKLNFSFEIPFKVNSYTFDLSLNSKINFVNYIDVSSGNERKVDFFSTFLKIFYENDKYRAYLKPFIFTSSDMNQIDMYFGVNYFIKKWKWPLKFIILRDNEGDFHDREITHSVYYSSSVYYKMNFPQVDNLLGFGVDFLNYLDLVGGYLYIEDFINIYNVYSRYVVRNITNAKFLFTKIQFSYKGENGELKLLSKYYEPISNDIFLIPVFVGEIFFKATLKDYNIVLRDMEIVSLLSYYSKFKLSPISNQNSVFFWDIEFIRNIKRDFFVSCGIKNIFDNNFDFFLYNNRNYGRLFFLKLGYNIKWK